MKASIFLFHRVSPQRDKLWDPLSPERFNEILNYLKNRFEIHSVEKILSLTPRHSKKEREKNSKPIAAIVFDDGYKDYIEYALPLLKKHNLPSSMYIVTSCVENGVPPWTYVLDNALTHTKKEKLNLDDSLLPLELKNTVWKNETDKINYAKKFKPFLKQVSDVSRRKLVEQTLCSLNDVETPQNMMMNREEINQIKSEGTLIGSHTVSHPLLAKMEDEREIENELKLSAEKIKELTGEFPHTISYPIGSFDERVKKLAQKSGYKYGLAVEQIQYESSKHDIYSVPRIELYNEPMLKTKLRINGTLEKIKKVLR